MLGKGRVGRSPSESRVLFVILDGVGVGALPDAALYGDEQTNTLGHVTGTVAVSLPRLTGMGIGLVAPLAGCPPVAHPTSVVGRLAERSPGKDSTTGHWEHMGLILERPFPTFPEGFPASFSEGLERLTGRPVLGNRVASGTDIMEELGVLHLRTGGPIVYTSADSVCQIAAHVEVIPLQELFSICETARELLSGAHAVGRVIARPFDGPPGAFKRTKDRRDYSVAPPGPTYVDELSARGIPVVGIGKVGDVFAERGFTSLQKTDSNAEGIRAAVTALAEAQQGLIFLNLNDFDTMHGHRHDVEGFARCLEAFDRQVALLQHALRPGDLLIITADHGCDPTDLSFDHSREYVPLLVYPGSGVRPTRRRGANLHRGPLSDSGATAFFHLTGERPPLAGSPLQSAGPPLVAGRRGRPATRGGRPSSTTPAVWRAASFLRVRMGIPSAAVILGSGLGDVATRLGAQVVCRATDVPGWPRGDVEGHDHLIEHARVGERPTCFVRGRVHGYEGASRSEQEFAVRVLAALGVECVLITNVCGLLPQVGAAGGTAVIPGLPALEESACPAPHVGGCALVETVLDLQGDPALSLEWEWGRSKGFTAGSGAVGLVPGLPRVHYAAVPGPQYETRAETRLLSALGCHVVGMSAAAEVAAARRRGLEYATLTVVTNVSGQCRQSAADGHRTVLERAARGVEEMAAVVEAILRRPAAPPYHRCRQAFD